MIKQRKRRGIPAGTVRGSYKKRTRKMSTYEVRSVLSRVGEEDSVKILACSNEFPRDISVEQLHTIWELLDRKNNKRKEASVDVVLTRHGLRGVRKKGKFKIITIESLALSNCNSEEEKLEYLAEIIETTRTELERMKVEWRI